MGPKPEMTSKTNPILASILKRYVGADSVGADIIDAPNKSGGSDWYNMTCPRCPWFVDGAKTGQYAPVTEKRDPGDSGRVTDDDTPLDATLDAAIGKLNVAQDKLAARNAKNDVKWDELLEGVDASIDADEETDWIDTDGVNADGVQVGNADGVYVGEELDIGGGSYSEPGGESRLPIVRCERPESQECLNESLCVKLLVAGDLIRQQMAVQRMMNDIESHAGGDNSVRHKLTKSARRSLKLRRASKKRGR
jgi:hypothetical protein